jgi:hypothetical protein
VSLRELILTRRKLVKIGSRRDTENQIPGRAKNNQRAENFSFARLCPICEFNFARDSISIQIQFKLNSQRIISSHIYFSHLRFAFEIRDSISFLRLATEIQFAFSFFQFAKLMARA